MQRQRHVGLNGKHGALRPCAVDHSECVPPRLVGAKQDRAHALYYHQADQGGHLHTRPAALARWRQSADRQLLVLRGDVQQLCTFTSRSATGRSRYDKHAAGQRTLTKAMVPSGAAVSGTSYANMREPQKQWCSAKTIWISSTPRGSTPSATQLASPAKPHDLHPTIHVGACRVDLGS